MIGLLRQLGVAGLMNHQTDDKLITGACVITASNDGLIHQRQSQDFIDSTNNKRFFLFTKGQGVSPTSIRVNIKTTGLLYFDGAEVGLKNAHSKDINGVRIDIHGGVYLTKFRAFNVSHLMEEVMTFSNLALAD